MLAEVDVPFDLAQSADNGQVGDAMRVGQRPKRSPESDGADRPCQLPRCLEPLSVHQRDIGADVGVLGNVPVEAVADLNVEVLRSDLVEQLLGLGVRAVDDRDHLQQFVKRDRDGRRFDVAGNHQRLPSFTQSTR